MKTKLDKVPEVGKTYNCFDDGKIRESRLYTVNVISVIPFIDIDDDTKQSWQQEVKDCYWLYSNKTDFFIRTLSADGDGELFVRTIDGTWFSVGGFLSGGLLDVDGRFTEMLNK